MDIRSIENIIAVLQERLHGLAQTGWERRPGIGDRSGRRLLRLTQQSRQKLIVKYHCEGILGVLE